MFLTSLNRLLIPGNCYQPRKFTEIALQPTTPRGMDSVHATRHLIIDTWAKDSGASSTTTTTARERANFAPLAMALNYYDTACWLGGRAMTGEVFPCCTGEYILGIFTTVSSF